VVETLGLALLIDLAESGEAMEEGAEEVVAEGARWGRRSRWR
jgi:hypothetical protein